MTGCMGTCLDAPSEINMCFDVRKLYAANDLSCTQPNGIAGSSSNKHPKWPTLINQEPGCKYLRFHRLSISWAFFKSDAFFLFFPCSLHNGVNVVDCRRRCIRRYVHCFRIIGKRFPRSSEIIRLGIRRIYD